MHALIIEDSLLIAMMVEDHLGELGYTSITVADNQAEAVAMAQARTPDLIAADDSLIEGSGILAVREICSDKVIPTIFMLGDPEKAREKDAPSHACVIAKPFLFDTLKEAVAAAIDKAQQVSANG